MGNCLVLQEKVIKVMKPDGKILEYRAPIKVHQVLSDFSGHAICDSVQAFRHLLPDNRLLVNHLYYLVPLPVPRPAVKKKKVRFSIPEEDRSSTKSEDGDRERSGVVRIKLVITKQELQEMLQKGGISVDDMVSQLQQDRQGLNNVNRCNNDDKLKGWKPVLENIPETC